MPGERKYWFPAKRYGWGWGIPSTWQGWLVLAGFVILLVIGSTLFPPRKQMWAYLAYVVALGALLIGICWLKGEPPRWRSGGDERR
jgi:lipoprotein signal peptidase